MPPPSTLFKNKEIPLGAVLTSGLMNLAESSLSSGGNFGQKSAAYFAACTGGGGLSDVAVGQSAAVNIIPASVVPYNLRCYLTRVDVDVQGDVSWSCTSPTGVPYLSVQDTLGTPLIHLPFNAMRGLSSYTFPDSDTPVPLLLGESTNTNAAATFTYNAATGVITSSAAVFVASIMVGTPVAVVDGTGKCQSGIVTACPDTTHITISPVFPNAIADHSSTAKDSVVAIYYQPLSAYTDATHVTIQNGGGTPYAANGFDNGYNLLGIAGAGVGQVRPIAANTTAGAMTLAYALNTAMNTTTTLVNVTNESNLNGAIDLCVGDKWATAQVNQGIQIAVNLQGGTAPLGSNVRVYVEGFFAS